MKVKMVKKKMDEAIFALFRAKRERFMKGLMLLLY